MSSSSNGFLIVKDRRPEARIVLGSAATPAERHAAEELQSFIQKISGAELPLISENTLSASADAKLILIGKPDTNSRILSAIGDFWKTTDHKFDTLLIRGDEKTLILSGDRDRSVIYAVYHLLEKFLHVGFFWDGDHIPAMDDIIIPKTELISESAFEYRFSKSASECNETYSFTTWWGFDRWKTEIDYMMKNKMNIARVKLAGDIIQNRAVRRLGVPGYHETELAKKRLAAAKEVYDYCHLVDLDIAGDLPCPVVSAAFKEKFPDAGYYAEMWCAVSEDRELLNKQPKQTLFTGSETYGLLTTAYLREWKEFYGTTDKFYVPRLPSESMMTCTLDEVFDNCLRGPLEAIRKVAPDAMLSVDGWMFRFMYKDFWANGGVEKLLSSLNIEDYYILDLCTPWSGSIPLYELDDYKWVGNRRFILSIINDFGGNNLLHGCYDTLIRESQKLITDKTNGCGIGNSAEVMYFSLHYYDLINHVGWEAPAIEKAAFVDEQALRRYGKDLYEDNIESYRTFVDAVYTGYKTKEPRYQLRTVLNSIKDREAGIDTETADKLAKYLDLSLPISAKGRQNRFLVADIYEGLRQYIGELYDIEAEHLESALFHKDEKAYKLHADAMIFLVERLEELTRSNKRWYLEFEARRIDGNMSINNGSDDFDSPEGIRKYMRDSGTTFAGSIPSLIDYSRKDYHELVKHYYLPRVRVGLDFMRGKLGLSPEEWEKTDKSEAINAFHEIEQNWAFKGYPTEEFDEVVPDLADTIGKVFSAISEYPVFRR